MFKTNRITFSLAVLVFSSITSPGIASDPTPDVVPAAHCDHALCQDAASAFRAGNYPQAAELYAAYFDILRNEDANNAAWLVHSAFANQQAEAWNQAAEQYFRASEDLPLLRDFLLTEAVRSSLFGTHRSDIFSLALRSAALSRGFEDGFFLQAQVEAATTGLPSQETIALALAHDDRDQVCPWLSTLLQTADDASSGRTDALFQEAYSFCVQEDIREILKGLSFSATPETRLKRATTLFYAVDFRASLAELNAIPDGTLSPVDQCRADFRRARNHIRLRQRDTAAAIYREIVARCIEEPNENERVSSLYGVGSRLYQLAANNQRQRQRRLDEAQGFFQQLLQEYPSRSHADDALFYLARIERLRPSPDRNREKALLYQALTDYPHGDMVHEMAWETFEHYFHDGLYREFIDNVTALPLPRWDRQYFSQGRLEYFVATAYAHLSKNDHAARYWQLAWVKYPFSFYGYLSNLRLKENGHVPEQLFEGESLNDVDWFQRDYSTSGSNLLAGAGHFSGACDVEASMISAESTEREKWRLAALCHRAQRFDQSHNIARRMIPGRPWSLPRTGRLIRWHVAWPDPFQADLRAAIERLGPEEESLSVAPSFASAIMREESGFIEDVVSWAGAVGLMQLMVPTARDHDHVVEGRADTDSLKRAEINIPIGIDHLAHLSRRYSGHPVMMTAAYNAGGGNVNSWLRRFPENEIALWVEQIPFNETRNYTKRVIGSYGAYQLLHGSEDLDNRLLNPAR